MGSFKARLDLHGLGKYAELLARNSIDGDVIADLNDADLEKLGIPMGDRRRFLKVAWGAEVEGADPLPLPGRDAERRQLTVMFADLVNSTKLAARLDPEDMKDVLAGYQKSVGEEAARFGGYVAKPLGDGLLIYFGWPQAHEDDAERAVRAGMAAIAAIRQSATVDGMALAVRIGISTGEVVVGDFTGTGVDELGAVVGETPNLAARLQSAASENTIVVTEKTMRLAGRQFAFTELAEQRLKGFDQPVRAFRVEGERASESRFDAMHGARLGTFVGREHEIGMLLQRWEEAIEGEPQLVLISGEAGIGKSRLVAECLGRISGTPRRIAYQGSPLHANTALYPVVRQLQSRALFGPDDTAAEKWAKLEAAIPGAAPRRTLALQFLAELMSLAVPVTFERQPRTSVDEHKDAAFEVLAEAARSEAEIAPLLIVVEDAHWIDATTQEFIERLLDRLQHCRAMVVVTYRPEFVPPWAQHANVSRLSLSRLGKRDARAIVDSLLSGERSLSQEIANDIVAKGDGIPLFVRELTGSVLEAARTTGDGGIQIPATLRDALSERLDRLGTAKEVAQIASAFGREFAADLLAATLGRAEDDLRADLERLMAIDVVFQSSRSARRYTFHHALLQEAAYESMLKSKRREVHARIAEVLTKHRPEMAEIEPEVLATHFARAGNNVRAAECWRKAGHLALRNSAYREAIGAFDSALPLLPKEAAKARADVHRAIASAHFVTGDHKSVREHLERAAAEAEAADDQVMVAEIAMQQGHDLIHYGGSVTDAVRFGERALTIATRLNDDALAYGARFTLGQVAQMGGDFAAGIEVLTANLPENLRDPGRVRDFGTAGSLVTDSMATLGTIYAYCGEFEKGLALLERADRLATTGAFDILVVQYHMNRTLLHRGDAATALPLLLDSVRHATEAGLKFGLPWLRALLGYARALGGDATEAVSLLRQAIAECDAIHLPYVKSLTTVYLAGALAASEPEQALEMAEAGLSLARASGYRVEEAELLRIEATALIGTDTREAEARANEGLALALKLGMRPEEGHAMRVLGDIKMRKGESPAARESYDSARAIYSKLGMTYWVERVKGPRNGAPGGS
ncbi:MAG: adenylate/guanylate cyclase domain-containing protein [Cucumibacter sp.]